MEAALHVLGLRELKSPLRRFTVTICTSPRSLENTLRRVSKVLQRLRRLHRRRFCILTVVAAAPPCAHSTTSSTPPDRDMSLPLSRTGTCSLLFRPSFASFRRPHPLPDALLM
ncbi:hypothetical protein AAHA92_33891 [Salvia divinorum]|uniref:Uncharacterized protein n=1 Tax=Salvia divinorum TaxID=28513 RepID=A0ABD1FKI8_SALDI